MSSGVKKRIDMAMSVFFEAGKQVQRHRDTASRDVQLCGLNKQDG